MRRDLEALLFATDQPLTVDKLAGFFKDVDRNAVREAIEELRAEYERDEHAFTVVEFGGGYSISTRPEHANLVRQLFKGRRKQRLSRAALEAVAIVAYKQPVTRLEIEEIRGVSATGVLGTLLERDLLQIVGRAETLGHPLLYGTTKSFLDYLGLSHVRELPQLSELEDLLAQKEELKQMASHRGEALEDDDIERAAAPEPEPELELTEAEPVVEDDADSEFADPDEAEIAVEEPSGDLAEEAKAAPPQAD